MLLLFRPHGRVTLDVALLSPIKDSSRATHDAAATSDHTLSTVALTQAPRRNAGEMARRILVARRLLVASVAPTTARTIGDAAAR